MSRDLLNSMLSQLTTPAQRAVASVFYDPLLGLGSNPAELHSEIMADWQPPEDETIRGIAARGGVHHLPIAMADNFRPEVRVVWDDQFAMASPARSAGTSWFDSCPQPKQTATSLGVRFTTSRAPKPMWRRMDRWPESFEPRLSRNPSPP